MLKAKNSKQILRQLTLILITITAFEYLGNTISWVDPKGCLVLELELATQYLHKIEYKERDVLLENKKKLNGIRSD